MVFVFWGVAATNKSRVFDILSPAHHAVVRLDISKGDFESDKENNDRHFHIVGWLDL